MSILFGIIFIAALVALVSFTASAGYGMVTTRSRQTKRELRQARHINDIQARALREILNGAGNPALEARIALDDVSSLEDKELH